MKQQFQHKLRMTPGVYYVWVGGSCDYGHEERCSGGAYILQKDEQVIETYSISDDHTTEFRMILTVMIHAMEVIRRNDPIWHYISVMLPEVKGLELQDEYNIVSPSSINVKNWIDVDIDINFLSRRYNHG